MAWTLAFLFGLHRIVLRFLRWRASYEWLVREKINGERLLRANSLRRSSGLRSLVMLTGFLIGCGAMLTPEPVRPALTLLQALQASGFIVIGGLLVVDTYLEDLALARMAKIGALKARRKDDPLYQAVRTLAVDDPRVIPDG